MMVARLRISFGLIDDVYARPMILAPCQKPFIITQWCFFMIAFDSGATHRCFRRFSNEPFARRQYDLPVYHL